MTPTKHLCALFEILALQLERYMDEDGYESGGPQGWVPTAPADAVEALREARTTLPLLLNVVEAAQDLYRSGYDGPFMGEPVEQLFRALARLEGRP